MKKYAVSLFLIVLFRLLLYSEDNAFIREKTINWLGGTLLIDIRMNTGIEDDLSPETRYLIERKIQNILPVYFIESILDIPCTSFQTIGECMESNEPLKQHLSNIGRKGEKVFANFSQNFKQVHARYSFSFFGEQGFTNPFVVHTEPYPLRRILAFEPSKKFTGLVIYAKGEYPAHGKDSMERLCPVLFPRIYDEDMNLVLSLEMTETEYIRKWGIVAYTDSHEEHKYLKRIGESPLRIMARGVFGKYSTDIIIPSDSARKLLCRQDNHKILREGRILVIID